MFPAVGGSAGCVWYSGGDGVLGSMGRVHVRLSSPSPSPLTSQQLRSPRIKARAGPSGLSCLALRESHVQTGP